MTPPEASLLTIVDVLRQHKIILPRPWLSGEQVHKVYPQFFAHNVGRLESKILCTGLLSEKSSSNIAVLAS